MLEMRLARPEELSETYALWQEVFGDGTEFQRQFYDLCCPQGPLILRDEGELRSMLALASADLAFADGWRVRGAYLYALATWPEDRGRGYAGQLMDYAALSMKEQGMDVIVTVPAQPALFDFFKAQGYEPGFYHLRTATPPSREGRAEPISPADYAALREELLAGHTHLVQGESWAAFQQVICRASGGDLYRLDLPQGPGCAAVERWSEGAVVKELLCLPGDEERAGETAAWLCGGRGELRTPCGPGEGVPFGAIRWLHGHPAPRWRADPRGYLGLAFD